MKIVIQSVNFFPNEGVLLLLYIINKAFNVLQMNMDLVVDFV